jgi:hypothetical protein
MRQFQIALTALVLALVAGVSQSADAGKPANAFKAPKPGSKAYVAMARGYKESIAPVFEAKCFDCHSAKTHFPWYYRMPLAKSMIDLDIRKARKALDLNDGFPFTGVGTLADHLSALKDVAADGSMPPFRYTMIHRSAKLTKAERDLVTAWADGKLPPAPSRKK